MSGRSRRAHLRTQRCPRRDRCWPRRCGSRDSGVHDGGISVWAAANTAPVSRQIVGWDRGRKSRRLPRARTLRPCSPIIISTSRRVSVTTTLYGSGAAPYRQRFHRQRARQRAVCDHISGFGLFALPGLVIPSAVFHRPVGRCQRCSGVTDCRSINYSRPDREVSKRVMDGPGFDTDGAVHRQTGRPNAGCCHIREMRVPSGRRFLIGAGPCSRSRRGGGRLVGDTRRHQHPARRSRSRCKRGDAHRDRDRDGQPRCSRSLSAPLCVRRDPGIVLRL